MAAAIQLRSGNSSSFKYGVICSFQSIFHAPRAACGESGSTKNNIIPAICTKFTPVNYRIGCTTQTFPVPPQFSIPVKTVTVAVESTWKLSANRPRFINFPTHNNRARRVLVSIQSRDIDPQLDQVRNKFSDHLPMEFLDTAILFIPLGSIRSSFAPLRKKICCVK